MPIPRVHLFELEDQPWFPAVIRDLVTDYLNFMEARSAMHRPAVSLVADLMRRTGARRIVDLCSGGGGSIPALIADLAIQEPAVQAILTDRFPNLEACSQVAAESDGRITFRDDSIDARAVPADLHGLRTLFNSFHHFRPMDARAILRDAVQARQPVAVFEVSQRRLTTLVLMALLTPWIVLLTTPAIRPFRWRRLVWTYLIPLVPLTCWWDGIVSQLRAYTPDELLALAQDPDSGSYQWVAGQAPLPNVNATMTYLTGYSIDSKGSS